MCVVIKFYDSETLQCSQVLNNFGTSLSLNKRYVREFLDPSTPETHNSRVNSPRATFDANLLEVGETLRHFRDMPLVSGNHDMSLSLPDRTLSSATPTTRFNFSSPFPCELRIVAPSRVSRSGAITVSTFGQLPTNLAVLLPIANSRTLGNRADFRLRPLVMGLRWLVLKISKVLRLGNRTRQSMNFDIKSFGAYLKYRSTERVLQNDNA